MDPGLFGIDPAREQTAGSRRIRPTAARRCKRARRWWFSLGLGLEEFSSSFRVLGGTEIKINSLGDLVLLPHQGAGLAGIDWNFVSDRAVGATLGAWSHRRFATRQDGGHDRNRKKPEWVKVHETVSLYQHELICQRRTWISFWLFARLNGALITT